MSESYPTRQGRMNWVPRPVLANSRNFRLEKRHAYMLLNSALSFCCLVMIVLGMGWSSYATFGPELWGWKGDLELLQAIPNIYLEGNPSLKAWPSFANRAQQESPDLKLRKYQPNPSSTTQRAWLLPSEFSRNDLGALTDDRAASWPRSLPSGSIRTDLEALQLDDGADSGPGSLPAESSRADLGALPDDGAGYMLYAPHNGFSNQARELSNALKIAFLLNRTLVVPPVLDHFELEQGTCLDPVYSPSDLRRRSWEAILSRFDTSEPVVRPYLSMADVVDLSSIKTLVKTIDLRVFLVLLCGMDVSAACSGPICLEMLSQFVHVPSDSSGKNFSSCESKLFSKNALQEPSLVYEVDEDCRSVIWTHNEPQDRTSALQGVVMDSLLADKPLLESISTNHTDRSESPLNIARKDLRRTLGAPSLASISPILSFGTLFSRPYRSKDLSNSWPYVHVIQLMVDIDSSHGDPAIQKGLEAIQYQPFSKHILNAATDFIEDNIKGHFFCAHVRLEDGAFVGHSVQQQKIFLPLQATLDSLASKSPTDGDGSQPRPLDVFLMADLKRKDWKSSESLQNFTTNPLYKIHTLDNRKSLSLVRATARKMLADEDGLALGFVPHFSRSAKSKSATLLDHFTTKVDIRLFIEEVVCSCATLGFQGTRGSTVTKNIMDLRKAKMCPLLNPVSALSALDSGI